MWREHNTYIFSYGEFRPHTESSRHVVYIYSAKVESWELKAKHCFLNSNIFGNIRRTPIYRDMKLIKYSFLSVLAKDSGTWMTETLNLVPEEKSVKKGNTENIKNLNWQEIYKSYVQSSTVTTNRNVKIIFISTVQLTSDFDVALN